MGTPEAGCLKARQPSHTFSARHLPLSPGFAFEMFGVSPAHLVVSTNAVARRLQAEHGAAFEHVLDAPGPVLDIGGVLYVLFKNVGPPDAAFRACKSPLKVAGVSLVVVEVCRALSVVVKSPANITTMPASPEELCAEVQDMEGIHLRPGRRAGSFVADDAMSAEASRSEPFYTGSNSLALLTLPSHAVSTPTVLLQRLCHPTWEIHICDGSFSVGFASSWEVASVSLKAAPLAEAKAVKQPLASNILKMASRSNASTLLSAATSNVDSASGAGSVWSSATPHSHGGPTGFQPPRLVPTKPIDCKKEPAVKVLVQEASRSRQRLVLTDLHDATPVSDLHRLLSAAGPLTLLALGPDNGRHSCVAFAEFCSSEDAALALHTFQDSPWLGRPLRITPSVGCGDTEQASDPFPPPAAGPYVYWDPKASPNLRRRRVVLFGFPPSTTAASLLAFVWRGGAELPSSLVLGPAYGQRRDPDHLERAAYAEYRSSADAAGARNALHGRKFLDCHIQAVYVSVE